MNAETFDWYAAIINLNNFRTYSKIKKCLLSNRCFHVDLVFLSRYQNNIDAPKIKNIRYNKWKEIVIVSKWNFQ